MTNVLRDALDILHQRGWHQGDVESKRNGGVCILGACGLAARSESEFGWAFAHEPEGKVLMDTIRELYPERYREHLDESENIWGFNDNEETVQADVETVLDKAAVRWEERV